MSHIDKELLRKQYNFLASYQWKENQEPMEVTGILNLLEELLDEKEGN